MSTTALPSLAGPTTHYELFAGLRDADVAFLVTGATALTLHGVPRLTPDVDLAVDADPANLERLRRLLAAWGYGQADSPAATAPRLPVRRYRHPTSALEEIDAVEMTTACFGRLRDSSARATIVDCAIPFVGAADLRALKDPSGPAPDPEGAAGLATLAAVQASAQGANEDTAREQIRKFSRWSVAARLDWLLAAARLHKGLSPEAKPMTRGLVRRRGWYGR